MAGNSEARRPRWYDENWIGRHPDPEKVACRDCRMREPDTEYVKGSTKIMCAAFGMKPHGVLWDGEECEYYAKE